MDITAYRLAGRFLGLKEVPGTKSNPLILWMLLLDSAWPSDDEVPWCSAFVNTICHFLDLPRSRSLAARSWLTIGDDVPLVAAQRGFDVVVLSRGSNPTQGHVGFFGGFDIHNPRNIYVRGGNQGDQVSDMLFPIDRVVGVRRLA